MSAFLRVFGFSLLCVFALLLVVSIVRECAGQTPITFAYILQSLQNCPNVVIQISTNFGISGDWGIFDFMRRFLNDLAYIIGFSVYIISLIIQLLMFIGYALTTLFSVAPATP